MYIAMQSEYKVIRLEQQVIHSHYSYILAEMPTDKIVPHMVERRLLSPTQAKGVHGLGSQLEKVSAVLRALRGNMIVGVLPTFCAALISAGLSHIAERLTYSKLQTPAIHLTDIFQSMCDVFHRVSMSPERQGSLTSTS